MSSGGDRPYKKYTSRLRNHLLFSITNTSVCVCSVSEKWLIKQKNIYRKKCRKKYKLLMCLSLTLCDIEAQLEELLIIHERNQHSMKQIINLIRSQLIKQTVRPQRLRFYGIHFTERVQCSRLNLFLNFFVSLPLGGALLPFKTWSLLIHMLTALIFVRHCC